MQQFIEIKEDSTGYHANMTVTSPGTEPLRPCPEGYAIVPEEMQPLDRFPYGHLTTKRVVDPATFNPETGLGEMCDQVDTWEGVDPPVYPDPTLYTGAETRKRAYTEWRFAEWRGEPMTVTELAEEWMYYAAEGKDDICTEITSAIDAAKAIIREKYPDRVPGYSEDEFVWLHPELEDQSEETV